MTTPATEIVFYGFDSLVGREVAVFCVGLDCGDFTVSASGTVTVPFQSDPDDLFTLARIQSVDAEDVDWGPLACDISIFIDPTTVTYTVPCAIGFAYTTRGKVLPPRAMDDVRSPLGTGLGKTNRPHQYAALVDSAIGVSFGTDFDDLRAAQFVNLDTSAVLNSATMFSGVHWATIDGGSSMDGSICWEISRPYPATIVALTGFIMTAEH